MLPKKLHSFDFIALITLLIVTFITFRYIQGFVKKQVEAKFNSQVDTMQNQFNLEIQNHINVLVGAKALFSASIEVGQDEFQIHSKAILGENPEHFSGIRSLAFARLVKTSELDAFSRSRGYKLEPDTKYTDHYFVDFVYLNRNSSIVAYGFDLVSDDARRLALEKARDTGLPVAYGPVKLKVPGDLEGFVVSLPIYKNGMAIDTIAEKREALTGFVQGVFIYKDFIESISSHEDYTSIDFSVIDQGKDVFNRESHENSQIQENYTERNVDIADRNWQIKAHRSLTADFGVEESFPVVIIALGVLISFLVFGMVYALSTSQERAQALAEEMTTQLKSKSEYIETVFASLPIGIAVNEIASRRTIYINKAFEDIYGWDKTELTTVDEFFEHVYPDPVYRKQIKDRVESDIASGDSQNMQWTDVEITTKTGEKRYVNAKNISLPTQGLMVSTVTDTTDSKKAQDILEAKMEELKKVNDLMVGRELKMSEMKKQMDELSRGTEGGEKNG